MLKNIFRSREKNITPPLKVKRYSCLRKMLQNSDGGIIHPSSEWECHYVNIWKSLPSDRPIKNRHLEVTIWSSMKNVIFTSPIPLYSWVPILACACICCVINEKSKFYTKNAQKTEKKRNISDWTSRFRDFRMAIRCTIHLQAAVLSHGFSSQFAVQRNEHILTKIVQNKLFLQKCGIDTKL